jgi:hypothetical protein
VKAKDASVKNTTTSQNLHQENDGVVYQDRKENMKAVKQEGHCSEMAVKHHRGPRCSMLRYMRKKVSIIYTTSAYKLLVHRGGLRVCGALGQCSVRGLRALKNVVGCECELDALLFM